MVTIDIETGNEVLIPYMLRQDKLPHSYRYYDPVLKIIDQLMVNDKRDFFFDKM